MKSILPALAISLVVFGALIYLSTRPPQAPPPSPPPPPPPTFTEIPKARSYETVVEVRDHLASRGVTCHSLRATENPYQFGECDTVLGVVDIFLESGVTWDHVLREGTPGVTGPNWVILANATSGDMIEAVDTAKLIQGAIGGRLVPAD